jgi:hypothetical protein
MAQMKILAMAIGALLAMPAVAWAQAGGRVPSAQALQALNEHALDDQARVQMGAGDARGALQLMRAQLAAHPDDTDARLDLVRYLTWNGNFAEAERVLLADPAAAQSTDGQALHASLLAWAGRIDAAQAANAPLLAATPDDFLANYTQAIALRQSSRPHAALPFVETVKRVKPNSKDATVLEKGTRVRTDSFVALEYVRSDDSDDLVSSRPTLRAELAHGEALRFTAELGFWDHRAPEGGPFATIDGHDSISETRGLVGLRYASSLRTEWAVAAGHSSIDGNGNSNGDGVTLWRAGVIHRANDSLRLGLGFDHDRVAISPRSLSLGLTRDGALGHLHWTPDMNWTGDLQLRRDHYSDSNNSTDWYATLRRAVVRQPGFSLDLGAALQLLSHDDDFGNGYYAPDDYRRYGLTALAYVGLSDNIGLSMQGGLGRQRDETFTSWRRANDFSAAMVFGILEPWQFSVFAAYTERVQNTGAYDGTSWGMTLTRRF